MSEFLLYDKATVGKKIQDKRLALGFTQDMLAERLGKSLRFVAEIERGAVGVSIGTLLALCGVLKTTPNDLLLPQAKEPDSQLEWLIQSLTHCPDSVRLTAIELVRTYLRSV
ncbi:MAG: helix-turn-helix transcriptional regulator [Candidatus Limiplasma sp.]|nr:helix-turn-helix transcriptional regulator [Candidatus Limiplasma sp.]